MELWILVSGVVISSGFNARQAVALAGNRVNCVEYFDSVPMDS